MRDITLGQIWDTILKLWRSTYSIWKIVLALFSVVFLMCLWLYSTPTTVIRNGEHVEMSQITIAPWGPPSMIVCFTYLFIYWLFRESKDYMDKQQKEYENRDRNFAR